MKILYNNNPTEFDNIEMALNFIAKNSIKAYTILANPDELPTIFKEFRLLQAKTLQNVADNMTAKYDRFQISKLESGKVKMGIETINQFAKALGLDTHIAISVK